MATTTVVEKVAEAVTEAVVTPFPSDAVLILTTGGTIDKTYSLEASDFVVGSPAARRLGKTVKIHRRVDIKEVCRKDSLGMSDEDRSALVKAAREARQKLIVVTHGTDTLVRSMVALKDIEHKTIVLTGATRPEAFKETDAYFNLGSALTVLPYLDPGVHAVFHGVVFSDPETLRKEGDTFLDDKTGKANNGRVGGNRRRSDDRSGRGGRGRSKGRGRGRGRAHAEAPEGGDAAPAAAPSESKPEATTTA